MLKVWVHILDEKYWETPGMVVALPWMPRIGETVYLSEDTLEQIISSGKMNGSVINDENIRLKDNFEVVDICYVENEIMPHIMLEMKNN